MRVGARVWNVSSVFPCGMNCQLLPEATVEHASSISTAIVTYFPGHMKFSGFVSNLGFIVANDTCTELVDLWIKDCTDAQRISTPNTGLLNSTNPHVRARRVRLQNVTGLVRDYKFATNPNPVGTDYGRYIFDPVSADGTPYDGYLLCWSGGGLIATEPYNSGVHGTPPAPLPFVHVATFEDSTGLVHVEIPFTALAGQTICTVIRHKVTSLADWSAAPTLSFEDAALPPLATGRVLASTTLTIADTDWHTSTLTYTPTITRPLVLRMQGQGGNAAGTGTGKLYWHHTDPADVAAPLMYSF
jgi:hypothetical protein